MLSILGSSQSLGYRSRRRAQTAPVPQLGRLCGVFDSKYCLRDLPGSFINLISGRVSTHRNPDAFVCRVSVKP